MGSLRAQETVGVVKLQRYHFCTHNECPRHDGRLEQYCALISLQPNQFREPRDLILEAHELIGEPCYRVCVYRLGTVFCQLVLSHILV